LIYQSVYMIHLLLFFPDGSLQLALGVRWMYSDNKNIYSTDPLMKQQVVVQCQSVILPNVSV